jgi:hypothetical protein
MLGGLDQQGDTEPARTRVVMQLQSGLASNRKSSQHLASLKQLCISSRCYPLCPQSLSDERNETRPSSFCHQGTANDAGPGKEWSTPTTPFLFSATVWSLTPPAFVWPLT